MRTDERLDPKQVFPTDTTGLAPATPAQVVRLRDGDRFDVARRDQAGA